MNGGLGPPAPAGPGQSPGLPLRPTPRPPCLVSRLRHFLAHLAPEPPMRLVALLCLLAAPAVAAAMTPDSAKDPNLWLESVSSARAMDWVKGQNAKSLGVLQGDPHYQTF